MKSTQFLWAICILGCIQEEWPTLDQSNKDPSDQGIYTSDTQNSDSYCDFEMITNPRCWTSEVQVSHDCHYNLLFTRYGNGWTGADATYSTPLPDGRILWMFGDTFLGTVRADRSRPGSPLLRNSLVIQDGDELVTKYQMDQGKPTSFISPTREDQWYWPLDATVFQNELHFLLGRLTQTQADGMWSFAYVGFDLAILSLDDFSVKSLQTKVSNPDISYGSCLWEDDDYTYIYGISTRPFQKRAHVARVAGRDLRQTWEFFNGTHWTEEPSNYVIAEGVSDQFSIFKNEGIYYIVTHEIIFGDKIFIAQSPSPTGPFSNRKTLYCTPESGGNIFTYNSSVHPELSENDELRISYNINSFDFGDLFENADLYRPRFIKVENWK